MKLITLLMIFALIGTCVALSTHGVIVKNQWHPLPYVLGGQEPGTMINETYNVSNETMQWIRDCRNGTKYVKVE